MIRLITHARFHQGKNFDFVYDFQNKYAKKYYLINYFFHFYQ